MWLYNSHCGNRVRQKFPIFCWDNHHDKTSHIWHAETLVRSPRMWSVKPCSAGEAPPSLHFPLSPLHWSGLYIYIGSAQWNIRQILRPAPLGLRYDRALCLGRRDDRIRRISQASNGKEPTRFMVTSWIVGSDEGHDSAIQSVFLFYYRMSTSATLCQDKKYLKKNISLSAKIGFLTVWGGKG